MWYVFNLTTGLQAGCGHDTQEDAIDHAKRVMGGKNCKKYLVAENPTIIEPAESHKITRLGV